MNEDVCEMLETLAEGRKGIVPTSNDAVMVFRADCGADDKQPFLYGSCVVFICQGEELHCNKDNYLIVAAPLPLGCITIASEQEPLQGFVVDIDPLRLHNIWSNLNQVTLTEGIKNSRSSERIA